MSIRIRELVKLVSRLCVATVLLGWAFSQVDFGQFLQTVRTARWPYLLGVWAATAAFFWVQSVALRLILKRQGCDVRLPTLFGASSITALYGLVLPGILSTGVKWYILSRDTGKGSNVLSSMLYNQVTLSMVMIAIGLAGLIVTNPTSALFARAGPQWLLPLVCGAILMLVVLAYALALNGRTGRAVVRLLEAALGLLPQTIRGKGHTILTQIAAFQTAGWRFHLTVVAINAFNGVLVGLLMYFSAAMAARVDVPLGVLIWLCAIVFTLGRLPISVANLGVREVTLVGLLAGYGVLESAALLMSMILFSSLIFMAAIGVLYQLLWTVRAKKAALAIEDDPS